MTTGWLTDPPAACAYGQATRACANVAPGMKDRLTALLPCVATTPIAGALGAAVDERLHQGLSHWISLCREGSLPYLQALWLQLQLMPFALIFMLSAAFLGTLAVVLRSGTPASARMLLAGHAGCVGATLLAPLVCPPLLGAGLGPGRALGGMLLAELTLTTALALGLLALARLRPAVARQSARGKPPRTIRAPVSGTMRFRRPRSRPWRSKVQHP